MADTTAAKTKLAAQQNRGRPAQTQQGDSSVAGLVAQMKPQIERALPKAMDADRFTRLVLTTLRTNPQLARAEGQSLLAACMLSAQLGLEPGPLGHAYFVPYKGKITFIIGYRGMLELARRSGEITSIEAREVREGDRFQVVYGLEPKLEHEPAMGERGEPTHFYGIAKFTDGGHYFEVLSRADVDSFRDRSMAKDNGPWVTDYVAMAKKTVIRRMAPYLPLSAEAARAVASDEGVVARLGDLGAGETEVPVTHTDTVEVEATVRDSDDDDDDGEGADTVEVSQLRKPQLQKRLHQAGLPTDGKVDELRDRLAAHLSDDDSGADVSPPAAAGAPPAAAGPSEPAGEGETPAPPSAPSPDPVPPWVDPDTWERWTWKEHAGKADVGSLQVVMALKGRLPDGVDEPARSADIDRLVATSDDLDELVHTVIEEQRP